MQKDLALVFLSVFFQSWVA